MNFSNNQQAFFALVEAGLWEKEARLSPYGNVDFPTVMRIAEEQSVIGLVAAGLEYVKDVKLPKEEVLQFVGSTLQIEQRNKAMNQFIARLVERLRTADVYTLLVKGQGVAQCYERPLWRASGDVDLYLSKENYEKAKNFLIPLAQHIEDEDKKRLHYGMTIEEWVVELHGTLHTWLSRKMNRVSDNVHQDIFFGGNVRSWNDGGVQVFLPSADNDVIIIFIHFINHFYGEGIGLRQVCDWCRLLWTFRESLNHGLLEKRVKKAGLMTEWRAFAAFAVDFLGMPLEAMPFYETSSVFIRKARKIAELIIETGSFGVNKDNSYRGKGRKWKENVITFSRRFGEFGRIASIFPVNAMLFFVNYVFNRVKAKI